MEQNRPSTSDRPQDEASTSDSDSEKGNTYRRYEEAKTIEGYDDIKVTPFNMKEELEEGHIEPDGSYVLDREKVDALRDPWADNIDWHRVALDEQQRNDRLAANPQDAAANQMPDNEGNNSVTDQQDTKTIHRQLMDLMQPNETVQQAMRRMRWPPGNKPVKSKDKKVLGENPNKEKLDRLIELAHQCLEAGDMDIYQKSYEHFRDTTRAQDASRQSNQQPINANNTRPPLETDMFD